MRHWLAIACLLPLLVGCNTVRPEPLPPYALSDADTETMLRGLYSAVKDLDEPGLRNLKAARNNGGEVYVCGWMHSENKYYRASEQAYTGTLSAGQSGLIDAAADEGVVQPLAIHLLRLDLLGHGVHELVVLPE